MSVNEDIRTTVVYYKSTASVPCAGRSVFPIEESQNLSVQDKKRTFVRRVE